MIPFNKKLDKVVDEKTMESVYNMVKTPKKYGAVMKYDDFYCDSPTLFKYNGLWYMYYITISKKVANSGYETRLAVSHNLFDWKEIGIMFSRDNSQKWYSRQMGGYAAFVNNEFGGDNEIHSINGKYYMSFLGADMDGYEPDPLLMGLAWSSEPTKNFKRLENPILRPDDVDSRQYERKTLYKSFMFEDVLNTTGYSYVNAYNAKDITNRERIYLAVSSDAEKWERYGKTPIIDDVTNNEKAIISGDPQIVRINDLYVMFYFRYNKGQGAYNTFACSYDLITWTKWDGEPLIKPEYNWENVHAHKSYVIKVNENVYHFYCAVNNKDERFIALAIN